MFFLLRWLYHFPFCPISLIYYLLIFFLIVSYSSFSCWFFIYDIVIYLIFHLFIFLLWFIICFHSFIFILCFILFLLFSLFFLCLLLIFRSGQQSFVCITFPPDFFGCQLFFCEFFETVCVYYVCSSCHQSDIFLLL